jgi:CubicO group peptidase (beta-lactamase class C family)
MVRRIRPLLRASAALTTFIAVALSCATAAGASGKSPSVRPQDIDRVFSQWNSTTPGCAVGVNVNGKVSVAKAYGMADLEHGAKNSVDTVFEAGSVSKQFTAAAVLMLARDGKLSLDDPVRKYIPELPDYGTPLTIRHMLSHTSGLRDWGDIAMLAGWPRGTRMHTDEDVLAILSRQRALNFLPGTQWSYNNSGFNLAEIIVSRVSGQSLAEFTRQRIFVPLGMTHTSWRDDYTRVVKNRATAYGKQPDGYHSEMPFENIHGQGGLLTTVGDLLKWNEHLSAPAGDASIVAEMETRGHLNDGRPHAYGLGLFLIRYQGVREIGHEGRTAAYTAFLARYPDRHLSVAVLCNETERGAPILGHAVVDLYLGEAPEQTAAMSENHPAPPPPPTLDPQDLQALAGRYSSDEVGSDAIVSVKDATLVLSLGTHIHAPLMPKDKDTFADDQLSVSFQRDVTGKATALAITTGRAWNVRFARASAQ